MLWRREYRLGDRDTHKVACNAQFSVLSAQIRNDRSYLLHVIGGSTKQEGLVDQGSSSLSHTASVRRLLLKRNLVAYACGHKPGQCSCWLFALRCVVHVSPCRTRPGENRWQSEKFRLQSSDYRSFLPGEDALSHTLVTCASCVRHVPLTVAARPSNAARLDVHMADGSVSHCGQNGDVDVN